LCWHSFVISIDEESGLVQGQLVDFVSMNERTDGVNERLFAWAIDNEYQFIIGKKRRTTTDY
jgi:hypothetical protein